MEYANPQIKQVAEQLRGRLPNLQNKEEIFKAVELKALFDGIKTLPADERAEYGRELNGLKKELQALVEEAAGSELPTLESIDVTAPFDINTPLNQHPQLLTSDTGSKHPLTTEMEHVLDIFYRMGFNAIESREIDDDYHMFTSLNFPGRYPDNVKSLPDVWGSTDDLN